LPQAEIQTKIVPKATGPGRYFQFPRSFLLL